MSIGELADAANLSRRAVRFYVQQKLLPMPHGLGRGTHYDPTHLARLRRIGELQAAGHSLDAIRRLLAGPDGGSPQSGEGPSADRPAEPERRRRAKPVLSAGLWTRLGLGEGVELHLDATRHNPDVAQLLAVRAAVRSILGLDPFEKNGGADDDGPARP